MFLKEKGSKKFIKNTVILWNFIISKIISIIRLWWYSFEQLYHYNQPLYIWMLKCILYCTLPQWCHFLCSGAQVGPCSAHSVQTPFQHQWHQHQPWQLQQVREETRRLFPVLRASQAHHPLCVCVCVCVCSLLSRSSSYTRRLNSQSSAEVSAPNPSLPRSSSYGRKLDDPSVTSVTTAASGLSRLSNLVAQRCVCLRARVIWLGLSCICTIWCVSRRSAQEEAEKKEPVSNSVTTTTTSGEPETKQRRKWVCDDFHTTEC